METPQQRRGEDTGFKSEDLILYQLAELKATVERGFQKMEGRFDRNEDRLSSLEKFRERVETAQIADAQNSARTRATWVPWALAVFAFFTGLIMFVLERGPT